MYIVSKSEEISFSLFHWGTYVIVRYVVISIALCKTLLNFSFRKKDGWTTETRKSFHACWASTEHAQIIFFGLSVTFESFLVYISQGNLRSIFAAQVLIVLIRRGPQLRFPTKYNYIQIPTKGDWAALCGKGQTRWSFLLFSCINSNVKHMYLHHFTWGESRKFNCGC